MRLAVFSDTHGSTSGMLAAARRVSPDVLIHLGDYYRDSGLLRIACPDIPLYAVSGNCDYSSTQPDTLSFLAGSVQVMATHGHRYNVKYGLDSLLNAAYFSGAKLVLYGHTHIPQVQDRGGIWVMNPGSAGMGPAPTFGVCDISDNGGIVCRVMEIKTPAY